MLHPPHILLLLGLAQQIPRGTFHHGILCKIEGDEYVIDLTKDGYRKVLAAAVKRFISSNVQKGVLLKRWKK